MWGREKIEWQDRAWRLLENKGQVECDDFAAGGAVVGLLGAGWGMRGVGLGWRGVVGGAGVGSLVGVMGYMGWRYGVKRRQWEEAVEKAVEEVNPAMPVLDEKGGERRR